MILYVILTFVAILIGMAISVMAFGTGGKRKKIFQNIYFSLEEVNGIGVLYTKTGEYSAILKMENPVQKYSADIDSYYEFNHLFTALAQTLGDGYAIHKQDVFIYNPQIQISAESETKRSIFREKDKTKRSKKESAQHSKSRNKSFVMTSVSAL